MVSLFSTYQAFLSGLPERETYAHADLLVPGLLIAEHERLRVFYAPFDWANPAAKVIILGITPGWTQMELACRAARAALAEGKSADEVCRAAKLHGSFAGPMRINLVRMLDTLDLPRLLGLRSASDLFGIARSLLHTASAIRYPVFVGTQNYTGTNPRPSNSPFLMRFARELLAPELESVPGAVIVPLGKSVEEVLQILAAEKRIRPGRWLSGFPHPSGANGHRVRLFSENRAALSRQLRDVLDRSGPPNTALNADAQTARAG
jgi:hypothetical protein